MMDVSPKFYVMFRISSAAFYPRQYKEIARILRDIADRVENEEITSGTIRDVNGNKVGIYTIKR